MATAPLPTPEAIKDAPTIIKIPNTLIMEKDGNMAREWIYFFNDIGRAVDQQITANLPELTQKLIDTVAETLQLGSDADVMRADIITIKGDVAENKTAIATNTTSIATNTSGLATANGKISTNIANIAANTGNIQTHSTTLADLEARVAALEAAP